jgi:hypothetical protein
MKKENLEKLALITATNIADISQDTVSSWKSELKVLKNVEVHPSAYAALLLESSIFGHYYVGEKFKEHMNENDQNIFSEELHNKVIFMLSMLIESKDVEKNSKTHEDMTRKMYETFAPEKRKFLSECKGNSILDVFRLGLRQTFNGCDDFKIKFFENTLGNRMRMKFAKLLTNKDTVNKFADDEFLDEQIFYTLADSLFSKFSALNFKQLSKDAE